MAIAAPCQTSAERKITTVLLALLLFSPLTTTVPVMAQETAAQEILTNDSIVRMVKAGLSEDVILEMIKSNPGNYSLTSNNLVRLKQQGVTDKMISAMMAKKSGAVAATPPAGQTRTPQVNRTSPPESANGQWRIRTTTDEMSGQSRLQAVMIANADSNGRHGNFEVTATCTARILAFTIIYHSAFDKDVGFQQTQGASMVTLYNGIGTMDTPKPQVNLRARIDDGKVMSLVSTSDYRNQAMVVFTQRTLRDALSRNPSGGAQDVLGDLQEMGMALGAAGTTAEAYHAHIIRVELPLANGDAPILVIRPQDPSFRAYASKCAAIDPSAFVNEIKGADGFVYGSATVTPSRLYQGTAEGFVTALPGFLQRAAPTAGFSAETAQKDAAFIAQVVRTCSQITPEMARSVTLKGTVAELLPKLGDQYKDCSGSVNVSDRLGTYNKEKERAVMLWIDSIGRRWQDGQGFIVTVFFSALPSDRGRIIVTPEDFMAVLGIAQARILPTR